MVNQVQIIEAIVVNIHLVKDRTLQDIMCIVLNGVRILLYGMLMVKSITEQAIGIQ